MRCLLFFFLFGCATYVDSIHAKFDRTERKAKQTKTAMPDEQGLEVLRVNKKNPGFNANEEPSILRRYSDGSLSKERKKSKDLVDNGSDGSLWNGSNPNNFLFTNDNRKTAGDIIQIQVMAKLKNEIAMELKKAFPDNPYDVKNAANDPKKNEEEDKSQDRISGIIAEEISRDHLLVKGRKGVLFKNRKRLIEVSALVSRKDISDVNVINSDAIIENSVKVVK